MPIFDVVKNAIFVVLMIALDQSYFVLGTVLFRSITVQNR